METIIHFVQRNGEGRRMALLRMLAGISLLLVVLMSTVQVCHVHGAPTAKKGSGQGVPGDGRPGPEDHCPLCVAMHSALPTDIHVAPEPLMLVRALDSVAADAERKFRWRFEMASRPPPPASLFA